MRLTIFVLSTFLALSATAAPFKMDGFRGIKWAAPIKKHAHELIELRNEGNLISYKRKNEKMKIGDAKIESIFYYFYKGKFSTVNINSKGFENSEFLVLAFKAKFGKSPDMPIEFYSWENKAVTITLLCHTKPETCSSWMRSEKIKNLIKKEKRDSAKKAINDF